MKRILKNLSLTSMLFLSYNVMSFASGTNDELGMVPAFKHCISFSNSLLPFMIFFLCLVAVGHVVSVILKRNDSTKDAHKTKEGF